MLSTPKIELLNVYFLKLTRNYTQSQKELLELEKEYETTLSDLGKTNSTVTLIRNLAHLEAFYLNNTEKAINLLVEAIEIPGINATQKAECKLELGDIDLFSGEVWEATLLYSQVDKAFKNDPLGHEAKFRNAKLSFYIGEFNWAKAQLDVLKAATSKLICNDAMELSLTISDNLSQDTTGAALMIYARASLLKYQNKDSQALNTLDSIELLQIPHTLFDDVLYTKAEIAVKQRNFTLADSLYAKIYLTYPTEILADNAMFKQAELNENQLNNKTKAMELYQEFLTKFPGSLFAVDARKRYRALRGDAL
jgi:outer membrane protein assembly factor BamD (BamD/ComL family)